MYEVESKPIHILWICTFLSVPAQSRHMLLYINSSPTIQWPTWKRASVAHINVGFLALQPARESPLAPRGSVESS